MSRKLLNNIMYLKNFRPKVGSKYREDADKVIAMYQSREIVNFKSALNLVSKLSSKRPEVIAKKMKDYFEIKKTLEPVKSHLYNGLDEQVDYKIKQPALRSTPVPKLKVMPSIKKKATIQPKLERFFMKANLTYSTTYEKTNKHRKTKELHTSSYKRIEHQVVELPIWARSKEEQELNFKMKSQMTYKKGIIIKKSDC